MFIGSAMKVTGSGSGLSPALSLELRSAALDSRLTFSRASAATDIINGALVVFGNDAARISTANGLLMEESRTNMVQNGSGWAFQNCTGTAGATDIAGGTTAYSVTAAAGTFKVTDEPSVTGSITSGQTITTSRFIKPGTATRFQLLTGAGKSGAYANFLLTGNGSVSASGGSALNPAVIYCGNGWYRVCMTYVATSTSSANGCSVYPIATGSEGRAQVVTYAGTETYISCFGQEEVGAFVTSYIPTTTSAATRATENCTMATTNWLNEAEGTFYVEGKTGIGLDAAASTNPRLLRIDNGGSTMAHEIRRNNADNTSRLGTTTSGTTELNLNTGAWGDLALIRTAYAYKNNDMAGSLNGSTVQTDTASPEGMPTGLSVLRLGSTASAGAFGGYVRSVRYWRMRLSNNQLQGITQ